MNNREGKIKNVAKTIIHAMLQKDPREWPPECTFLIYQPLRPSAKEINAKDSLEEISAADNR